MASKNVRARKARVLSPRKPCVRVFLGKAIAMGPGKADLVRAIDDTGSISAAARALGMSYRRAWQLVDTMNRCFKSPIIDTLTGGSHGGGARVTESGHDILRRYLKMEARAVASIKKDLDDFMRLMT